MHRTTFALLLTALALSAAPARTVAADYQSQWHNTHDRVWVGGDYWANPMEDWRIADGRLECTKAGPNRNVALLTREIADASKPFELRVKVGRIVIGKAGGTAGFRLGLRDEIDDHRAAVLRGSGLNVGVRAGGMLFIEQIPKLPSGFDTFPPKGMELRLRGEPAGDKVKLTLTGNDIDTGKEMFITSRQVAAERVVGPVALVNNHFGGARRGAKPAAGATARYWFRDFQITGEGVKAHDDRAFGPILWAMHTLSDSRGRDGHVLKLTAQMPPLGAKDNPKVQLDLSQGATDGKWDQAAEATIDPLARTARFRIHKWDASKPRHYRLRYEAIGKDGSKHTHEWRGTIRAEPNGRPVVVAGFTGNQDYVFPNVELTRNVAIHNPDVLFFSGDQIYESVGGYGIIREPAEPSTLNYLRKWYLLGWSFRDLMRDRLTICLPDDHDVYQGNIWGEGGKAMAKGGSASSNGGYRQPPAMVNAVHRTQCSHHPDVLNPDDAKPVAQGITPFYSDMVYGGVSFAIIGDRQFKNGPGHVSTWKGRADHLRDPKYDVSKLDKPGLHLLGERQERFLNVWAQDWRGAYLKCVLSATIFCNLANYHGPSQQFIFADLDSNGWPQSGRRRALEAMRRGLAFHLAGDQHLASIVHHGIDTWNDAGYSFCVPSIAAGYPRAWRPDAEGRPVRNRPAGGLANTGEYQDGFGNYVTVYGIGNPAKQNRRGRVNTAHDKASGYGIVRFDTQKQAMTMECWRLQFDAKKPQAGDQFPGWPKTVHLSENDGRKAAAHLPTIQVNGTTDPVVTVVNEKSGDVEYALRIRGASHRPKVFDAGATYTVKVNDKVLKGVKPSDAGKLTVDF